MVMHLADNIRAHRRARSLTQQQLADALGVTVGAVYKWEASLSAPDLSLLVELADLFDTSVDVLLGYEAKGNKPAETAARLKTYLREKNREGLAEAEKALLRYPNCFDVVYQGAMLYYLFGVMGDDKALYRRSVELIQRAMMLLGQNTDPEIGELSLTYDLAGAYFGLGDYDKALDLLKMNNPRNIFADTIGQSLVCLCDRPDEAEGYLSSALVTLSVMLVRTVMGLTNVYFKLEDYTLSEAILQLALSYFAGLKQDGKSNLLDKPCADFYVCLAHAQINLGRLEEARASLLQAKMLSAAFDACPDYSADNLRFVRGGKRHTAFDDLGSSAAEAVSKAVHSADCAELVALWEEIGGETES